MARRIALAFDEGRPQLAHEPPRRVEAAVEVERTDQRFDDVPDDVFATRRAILARLLAKSELRRNPGFDADLPTRRARHEHREAVRQLAFGLLRKALLEPFGHDQSEHAVAEEFEALVIVLAEARVGEGLLKQAGLLRLIPDGVAHEVEEFAHPGTPV